MFEGQRLSYIVPGYTGHIPKKVYDHTQPIEHKPGESHIPGYAGYVHSIKSENLYSDTFGKTTFNVNTNQYVKGQDVPPREKYVSSQTRNNIPPSEMLRRTAAEVVGIPNKQIKINEPRLGNPTGPQVDQFTVSRSNQFKETMSSRVNPWVDHKVVEKQGKEYVKLETPLPGYTGFGKRVMANNIFGKTFAECRKESVNDDERLLHDRKKNFDTQLKADVPVKF